MEAPSACPALGFELRGWSSSVERFRSPSPIICRTQPLQHEVSANIDFCGSWKLLSRASFGLRPGTELEIMTAMGVISRSIDRLPGWFRVSLMLLGLAAFVYGVATEGWTFILKAIFSPEL
jgi:hypothetical protein